MSLAGRGSAGHGRGTRNLRDGAGPAGAVGREKEPDVGGKNPLRTYRGKRDFARTGEPRGLVRPSDDEPHFVVQIHDASTMHFDFRLQVDDVLKSYEEFEGVIPEGVPFDQALERGHATFWLDGSKLRGGYALTRFRDGKSEAWLLVKTGDERARAGENGTGRPIRGRPARCAAGAPCGRSPERGERR